MQYFHMIDVNENGLLRSTLSASYSIAMLLPEVDSYEFKKGTSQLGNNRSVGTKTDTNVTKVLIILKRSFESACVCRPFLNKITVCR